MSAEVQRIKELVGEYWDLAYAEGREGRDHDTPEGDAARTLHAINEELAALEARVREIEAREEVLQRALSRWLPQIAGDDERGPMYAAASEDSMLLMGLCDETAESEWYGQHILQRAEQAEAALSVVRRLPEKWRERKPGAGRMSDLSNAVRKTCADELSAAIAHGGAGEGEKK